MNLSAWVHSSVTADPLGNDGRTVIRAFAFSYMFSSFFPVYCCRVMCIFSKVGGERKCFQQSNKTGIFQKFIYKNIITDTDIFNRTLRLVKCYIYVWGDGI